MTSETRRHPYWVFPDRETMAERHKTSASGPMFVRSWWAALEARLVSVEPDGRPRVASDDRDDRDVRYANRAVAAGIVFA